MSINVVPHLNFRGEARAALAFYRSVFVGDQVVVSYGDAGQVGEASEADQVLWGQVTAGNGFRVMAYDVPARTPWSPGERPFFVSVRGNAAEEITRYWDGLRGGGKILQPLKL